MLSQGKRKVAIERHHFQFLEKLWSKSIVKGRGEGEAVKGRERNGNKEIPPFIDFNSGRGKFGT